MTSEPAVPWVLQSTEEGNCLPEVPRVWFAWPELKIAPTLPPGLRGDGASPRKLALVPQAQLGGPPGAPAAPQAHLLINALPCWALVAS